MPVRGRNAATQIGSAGSNPSHGHSNCNDYNFRFIVTVDQIPLFQARRRTGFRLFCPAVSFFEPFMLSSTSLGFVAMNRFNASSNDMLRRRGGSGGALLIFFFFMRSAPYTAT